MDKPEKEHDEKLSKHILQTHARGEARMVPEGSGVSGVDVGMILNQTESIKPVYDIETLRKYVAYSKRITPVMSDEAMKIIQDSFLRIRKMGNGKSVPITARQLEGYVRLAEASAKMRLSDTITDRDANIAADLVEQYLDRIAGNGDGTYDIDKIASGISSKDRDVLDIIRKYIEENSDLGVRMDDVLTYATSAGLTDNQAERAMKQLKENGEVYSPSSGLYKKA